MFEEFARLGLEINVAPGKTEVALAFRGKRAALERQRLRDKDNLIHCTPGANSVAIRIVDDYAHLGSVLSCYGDAVDASNRVSKALASYAPIAFTIFGNKTYEVKDRISLFFALIVSRLLYNVHVWTEVSVGALKRLNGMYMRGLRRIGGWARIGRTLPDLEVRRRLGVPSLDCLLARARLKYLRSVLAAPSPLTRAALAACPGSLWSRQIVEDMRLLKRAHPTKLAALGDPVEQAVEWQDIMLKYPLEWKALVNGLHFCESHADPPKHTRRWIGRCRSAPQGFPLRPLPNALRE